MSKFYIINDQVRSNAIEAIKAIMFDNNMVVEIKKRTRTLDQNSKMWSMLTELECQVPIYHGINMTKEMYKDLFTGSLKGCQFVPAVGGYGMVGIGGSSSKLTTTEMADLITLIEMFGAENNVKFKDVRYA